MSMSMYVILRAAKFLLESSFTSTSTVTTTTWCWKAGTTVKACTKRKKRALEVNGLSVDDEVSPTRF